MKDKLINIPHDQFVRANLLKPDMAEAFLQVHLPVELKSKCDLNDIQVEPTSYIDDELKASYSDILYKLKSKDGKNSAYAYIMIEHQSDAVKLMPLRIIEYQIRIIRAHLDKNKGEDQLPLVVPFVVYNGTSSPYPYPCDIGELFANKELYKEYGLGRFRLIDLTIISDTEILKHGKIMLMETLAKHIRFRNFRVSRKAIVDALQLAIIEKLCNDADIDMVFQYLGATSSYEDVKQLFDKIRQEIPHLKGTTMTYNEYMQQIGMEKGRQEGRQVGIDEARHEIAIEFLTLGTDPETVAKATHLSLDEIKKLQSSATKHAKR